MAHYLQLGQRQTQIALGLTAIQPARTAFYFGPLAQLLIQRHASADIATLRSAIHPVLTPHLRSANR